MSNQFRAHMYDSTEWCYYCYPYVYIKKANEWIKCPKQSLLCENWFFVLFYMWYYFNCVKYNYLIWYTIWTQGVKSIRDITMPFLWWKSSLSSCSSWLLPEGKKPSHNSLVINVSKLETWMRKKPCQGTNEELDLWIPERCYNANH